MAESQPKPDIVVVGGAVMDLMFRAREMPRWHEAVQADSFRMVPGGKGLNQAVAAARLGAKVDLVSAIGDDAFGHQILEFLDTEGVGRSMVKMVPRERTAVTAVIVNHQGDPGFVGWKNVTKDRVDRAAVEQAKDLIAAADVALVTFEVSLEAVRYAIDLAHDNETMVIVNPAPPLVRPEVLTRPFLQRVSMLVPNVWEAESFAEMPGASPEDLARQLLTIGAQRACVTTAALGCVYAERGKVTTVPPFGSRPEDSTGASDAFCAALALAMAGGLQLEDALRRANAAGAYSVGVFGAAQSMPRAEDIDKVLETFVAGMERKV